MKRLFLYNLCFMLLLSCGKHHDKPGGDPDPAPENILLKSLNGNTFTYDAQGRLIKETFSNSVVAYTTYTYTKDSVVGKDFDRQGLPHAGGGVIFYLGADGLATREKFIFDDSAPAFIIDFSYNAGKQLVQEIIREEGEEPASKILMYYSGGNMDSTRSISLKTGDTLRTVYYYYYTDKPNLLSTQHNGISYVGVGSVNLEMKDLQIIPGTPNILTEYGYEFDAKGRPVVRHARVDGVPFNDQTFTWY